MKRFFGIFLLITAGFSSGILHATDTISVKSSVQSVTVFFQGAEVVRKTSVNLPAGTSFLKFADLPFGLNESGLQASLQPGLNLLSIQLSSHNPLVVKKSKTVKRMEDSLKTMELEMERLGRELEVLQSEEKILLDNAVLHSENQGTKVQDLKEMADYFRNRMLSISERKLKISEQLRKQKERIEEMQQRIQEQQIRDSRPRSEATLRVQAASAGKYQIQLSYVVQNAGWIPVYRFRVNELDQPLSIDYMAQIYQTSGEDWRNVDVSVSSADPDKTLELPELKTWYFGSALPYPRFQPGLFSGNAALEIVISDIKNEPVPFANVILSQNGIPVAVQKSEISGNVIFRGLQMGTYTIHIASTGFQTVDKFIDFNSGNTQNLHIVLHRQETISGEILREFSNKEEATITFSRENVMRAPSRGISTMSNQNVNTRGARGEVDVIIDGVRIRDDIYSPPPVERQMVSFVVSGKSDIPSDGQNHEVFLKTEAHPARFVHWAAPLIRPEVYLTAELENWRRLQLLPGQIRIQLQQNYNGEFSFNPYSVGDTLQISLGPDPMIQVHRQTEVMKNSKVFLSNQIRETFNYVYQIRNNRDREIRLSLKDQVPVTVNTQTEVNIEEKSGAVHAIATGILTWDLKVAPATSEQRQLRYQTRRPK